MSMINRFNYDSILIVLQLVDVVPLKIGDTISALIIHGSKVSDTKLKILLYITFD